MKSILYNYLTRIDNLLITFALACLSLSLFLHFHNRNTIIFSPPNGMTRSQINYVKTVEKPQAVLVLAAGFNSNCISWVQSERWRNFAEKNNLGLIGLSFASKIEDLQNGNGYYYVWNGSGAILEKAVKRIYGSELPMLMYGYSGGAHFVSRYAEWKPKRVLSFCAYSAGWWTPPVKSKHSPAGLIVCGTKDRRYQASYDYYRTGIELGKPWEWLDLPQRGHEYNIEAEIAARKFFIKNFSLSDER